MPSLRSAAIITMSDGVSYGTRIDKSGELLAQLTQTAGFIIVLQTVVPDNFDEIVSILIDLCDNHPVDVILTTGGTGLGPRDVTPEATTAVIERTIPGIAEAIRAEGLKKTPMAMTSRQIAGVRKQTLIVNFPGSPKAVQEGFAVISPTLHHIVDLLHGLTEHNKQ